MAREWIDRGTPLEGINRTVRDSRIATNTARSIQNFRLPDGRLRRRKGKQPYGDVFRGSQIMRHTPFQLASGQKTDNNEVGTYAVSPMSYGYLRWHDDFQPKSTRDWTIEFLLTLGNDEEVMRLRRVRLSRNSYGTGGEQVYLRAGEADGTNIGAVVYDQSVTANFCWMADTTTGAAATARFATDPTATLASSGAHDTFSLTSLCVSYTSQAVKVSFDTYDTVNDRYIPHCLSSHINYIPGESVHVAVRFDSSELQLDVLLDGVVTASHVLQSSSSVTEVFAGEYDVVNGTTWSSGIRRDIVLLNEYTVRGGMSSTCKIHQASSTQRADMAEMIYSYDNTDYEFWPYEPPVICHSPPSGTGMTELRYWHTHRSDIEILNCMGRRLVNDDIGSATLAGYWRFDETSGVCVESRMPSQTLATSRLITLHHGDPSFVADGGMSHGFGLAISEGQHLKLEYVSGEQGGLIADDTYLGLQTCLESAWAQDELEYHPEHDFTVVMEIRTPNSFGQEINARDGDDTALDAWGVVNAQYPAGTRYSAAKTESTRQELDYTYFRLTNANPFSDTFTYPFAPTGQIYVTGVLQPYDTSLIHPVWNRAWDQTLFSVEAEAVMDGVGVTDEADWSTMDAENSREALRFPIVRGLLTPDGRVAFEWHGMTVQFDGAESEYLHYPRQIRLVSEDALDPNTVYRIGFRKRTIYKYDTTDESYEPIGFRCEVFIEGGDIALPDPSASGTLTTELANNSIAVGRRNSGTSDSEIDIPTAVVGLPTNTQPKWHSGTMPYRYLRDVLIGASYVNDYTDRSFRTRTTASTGYFPLVTQRYLSPYQDQPGCFTFGFFRMWTSSLNDSDMRRAMGGAEVSKKTLLYNVTVITPSGNQLISRGAGKAIFETGHKSWGVFESATNQTEWDEAWCPKSGHFLTDRIGYGPLPSGFFPARWAKCQALTPYASTLDRRYGILAAFDGALYLDDNLAGTFQQVTAPSIGLLDDFSSHGRWRGTNIGDRTVLTSESGRVKSWNGQDITVLGFRKWSGGWSKIQSTTSNGFSSSAGNLPYGTSDLSQDAWYGFRLAYISQDAGILYVSPQSVVWANGDGGSNTTQGFLFSDIQPSPDPRVTSIAIYATPPLTTREEARFSDLLQHTGHVLENSYAKSYQMNWVEELGAIDLSRTPFPVCAYAATAYERLYLAGDVTIPDIIYFTAPGNPESINITSNRIVLEDGTGDAIVGLRSGFGALYAFKPSGIYRIDEPYADPNGVVIHNRPVKVSHVGPLSPDSIALITLPDAGRLAFMFWGVNGPYMFDGLNTTMIGSPIEGVDPFGNIDASTVLTLHDQKNREVSFLYRHTDDDGKALSASQDRALVFNYRMNTWTEDTGVMGTVPLSADVSDDRSQKDLSGGATVGSAVGGVTTRHLALVGTGHGRILQWGIGYRDGFDESRLPRRGTISAWDSTNSILSIGWDAIDYGGVQVSTQEDGGLRGVWVTIFREDLSQWMLRQIVDNDDLTITIDVGYGGLDFTPEAEDLVFIGLPPAYVEFPWDSMGMPVNEKQIVRMTMWGDGDFFFRTAQDWRKDTTTPWRQVQQEGGQRHHMEMKHHTEAVKLWIASLSEGAELHSYGFMVDVKGDGNKAQR